MKEVVLKDDFVEDAVVDNCVSFDGTWQKREYASINGVVTGYLVKVNVLISKVCKLCQYWKDKEGTEKYLKWKDTRVCNMMVCRQNGM